MCLISSAFYICFLQVVDAIKKILYAAKEDASILEEAQAMILNQGVDSTLLRETVEEDQSKSNNTQKRKSSVNEEADALANTALSPRLRVSDASDVHSHG